MASDVVRDLVQFLRDRVHTYLGVDMFDALPPGGGLLSWSGVLGLLAFLVQTPPRHIHPTHPSGAHARVCG